MNIIFFLSLTASIIFLLFKNPDLIITCFTTGIEKSLSTALSLFSVYALWLGLFNLVKDDLIKLLSKVFFKPISLIFGESKAQEFLSINIVGNILGIGGVSTENGILAMSILERENNRYGQNMLFCLTSSSLQLLPTTVITILSTLNAKNPSSIILPTLLTTIFATALSYILVRLTKK